MIYATWKAKKFIFITTQAAEKTYVFGKENLQDDKIKAIVDLELNCEKIKCIVHKDLVEFQRYFLEFQKYFFILGNLCCRQLDKLNPSI